MSNLPQIFNSIVPENIKNIAVINDSMDIFIELLEDKSKASIDIMNFLNEHTTSDVVKQELIKIYLYDYFSMVERLKSNYSITEKLKKQNMLLRQSLYDDNSFDATISDKTVINYFTIGGTIIESSYSDPSFDDILDSEVNLNPIYDKIANLEKAMLNANPDNFYFNRLFKETKGFISSIRFMYDCVNKHLIPEDELLPLLVEETNEPFNLKITGSLDRDIYRNSVEYLTHPLGFVYDYEQIRQVRFEDYFSVVFDYYDSEIEVRCLQGNVERYEQDIKEVIKYNGTIKVIFQDGTMLVQENRQVKYYGANRDLIKAYPASGNCAIYLSYKVRYIPQIKDDVKFEQIFNVPILDNDKMSTYLSDLELKTHLTYTPYPGSVIGTFTIGDGTRFNAVDSNYYTHKTADEFNIIKLNNLNLGDGLTFKENVSFEAQKKLTDNIEKTEEYSILTNNIISDDVIISDKLTTGLNDSFESTYDKDITQEIRFTVPITEIDNLEYNDFSNIITQNPISDLLDINDTNIVSILMFSLKDIIKYQDDLHTFDKETINTDTNEFDDSMISSTRIKLSDDIYQHTITDTFEIEIDYVLRLSDTTNFNLTEEFEQFSEIKFEENLNISDDATFSINTDFKPIFNVIGMGTIDGTTIINDNDIVETYKYNDTMDISEI